MTTSTLLMIPGRTLVARAVLAGPAQSHGGARAAVVDFDG